MLVKSILRMEFIIWFLYYNLVNFVFNIIFMDFMKINVYRVKCDISVLKISDKLSVFKF